MVYRVCLQTKIEKLSLWDNDIWLILSQVHVICYMQIEKQLIKLVYNDVKNLT